MTIHRAESIEALIEKTGVGPYLATTLNEFNKAVETNTVHQLPVPKTEKVRALVSPPYFGFWCLPGGGIEPGETPADAAVREAFAVVVVISSIASGRLARTDA